MLITALVWVAEVPLVHSSSRTWHVRHIIPGCFQGRILAGASTVSTGAHWRTLWERVPLAYRAPAVPWKARFRGHFSGQRGGESSPSSSLIFSLSSLNLVVVRLSMYLTTVLSIPKFVCLNVMLLGPAQICLSLLFFSCACVCACVRCVV